MLDRIRRLGYAVADWCSFQMGTIEMWLCPPRETPVDKAIREGRRAAVQSVPVSDPLSPAVGTAA
jgi:hypothetical protein